MLRRSPLLPWLSLSVIYVVWGSTYLAIRIVVQEMPPFAAASLRFLVAGSGLAVLALKADRGAGLPARRALRDYAIAGVLLLAAGNAGVMWAETRVSSGLAALLVATVPVWIALLDGFRPGGQRWTSRLWFGVLIGLAGVALVARPQGGASEWAGVAALQFGAFSWTLGVLWVKASPQKLPTLSAASIEMLAGSAVLFLESRIAREDGTALWHASSSAWLALGFLVIFGSMVAFTAFAYCLNELPASVVGTYAYVNPVVAVALGRVVLGEPLSYSMALGAALIVFAVAVVTTQGIKRVEPCEA
jgi:drug/metabolite transporter (DMT)-like permease